MPDNKEMTETGGKVWFVTGASRGLGAAITGAALAAGNMVVAAARNPATVTNTLGEAGSRLLPVALDVTDARAATEAVEAAVARFGRVDVLVNNAGYGLYGAFEEMTPEEVAQQFATNVFGLMSVTRAVLPVMRRQHSGRILNIASVGGYRGSDRGSIYSASKFAVEGFSESLGIELAELGVRVTIVEPGFMRTDFLEHGSVRFGSNPIEEYAAGTAARRAFFAQRSGEQAGDPTKLGQALVKLADDPEPPTRFQAGTDAMEGMRQKNAHVQAEMERWRALSASTDFTE